MALLLLFGLAFICVEICADHEGLSAQRSQVDLQLNSHHQNFLSPEGVILLVIFLLLLPNNINQQHLFSVKYIFPCHTYY